MCGVIRKGQGPTTAAIQGAWRRGRPRFSAPPTPQTPGTVSRASRAIPGTDQRKGDGRPAADVGNMSEYSHLTPELCNKRGSGTHRPAMGTCAMLENSTAGGVERSDLSDRSRGKAKFGHLVPNHHRWNRHYRYGSSGESVVCPSEPTHLPLPGPKLHQPRPQAIGTNPAVLTGGVVRLNTAMYQLNLGRDPVQGFGELAPKVLGRLWKSSSLADDTSYPRGLGLTEQVCTT
ncbi:hypothetical protein Bbelb_405280 [Branchiostoma belcheri]|nr:hypothetical protein Bbelb_405280 [Branchiostoma belcheri]